MTGLSSVAVFCGSRFGTDPAYEAAAVEVGRTLAERGITLVYGGGRVGLMGAVADAAVAGRRLLEGLRGLAEQFPGRVFDPRGRGLMCAFSMPSAAERDELIGRLWARQVIMLASGPDSVRFRPALTVTAAEIDTAVDAVRDVLSGM